MNRILQYIEEHIEENLCIRILANEAGYSEYYFIRKFKKYTGKTVMEYICRRRMILASGDILAGMRIIDVAVKYGWESHSAFSKSFRREFGFQPSLLRTMKIELDCIGGSCMNALFMNNTQIGTNKEQLLEILKKVASENGICFEEKNCRRRIMYRVRHMKVK